MPNMWIADSKSGAHIRLTEERWRHITCRHPEMQATRGCVLETLADPEWIQGGDYGEFLAIRYYADTALAGKYLVVVYRELAAYEGFILTAYLTKRPSARRVTLWKR